MNFFSDDYSKSSIKPPLPNKPHSSPHPYPNPYPHPLFLNNRMQHFINNGPVLLFKTIEQLFLEPEWALSQ